MYLPILEYLKDSCPTPDYSVRVKKTWNINTRQIKKYLQKEHSEKLFVIGSSTFPFISYTIYRNLELSNFKTHIHLIILLHLHQSIITNPTRYKNYTIIGSTVYIKSIITTITKSPLVTLP